MFHDYPKFLIIGEAGERPFEDSPSATRLRTWFGVTSHEGLKALAHLTNVYRCKDHRTTPNHSKHVAALIRSVKHVVLVGRIAQLKYGHCITDKLVWHTDNTMGLPHPSGLNRQLNGVDDAQIAEQVDKTLREWGYR
jgi:uracil-DNA glycosylase